MRLAVTRRAYFSRRTNAGMSMLEVLIAVLVLAIGLLGVAALQAAALRNSQGSMGRSQAIIESYAMLDSIRAALPPEAISNAAAKTAALDAYDLAKTCAAPTDTSTLAKYDINLWIDTMHKTLAPGSCGTINCDKSVCTVTVEWTEQATGSGGANTYNITTMSRI